MIYYNTYILLFILLLFVIVRYCSLVFFDAYFFSCTKNRPAGMARTGKNAVLEFARLRVRIGAKVA